MSYMRMLLENRVNQYGKVNFAQYSHAWTAVVTIAKRDKQNS